MCAKEIRRGRLQSPVVIVAVTAWLLPAVAALADEPVDNRQPTIEQAKLDLLEAYYRKTPDERLAARKLLQAESDAGDSLAPEETMDQKLGDSARPQTGGTFVFYGTGFFSLRVEISARASNSCLGYIVDAPDEEHQDMAILVDLRNLQVGAHTVDAACTDHDKSFPADAMRMASTPWTDDSSNHWAYWVRMAVTTGASGGYTFDDIQASVWYITDRTGQYDSLDLLRAIGYPQNGPSKDTDTSSGLCGVCGPGFLPIMPLTVLGFLAMKWCCRRQLRW